MWSWLWDVYVEADFLASFCSVEFEDGENVLQLKGRIAKLRGFDESEEVSEVTLGVGFLGCIEWQRVGVQALKDTKEGLKLIHAGQVCTVDAPIELSHGKLVPLLDNTML